MNRPLMQRLRRQCLRQQLPMHESRIDWGSVQRHFVLAMVPWLIAHPILLGAQALEASFSFGAALAAGFVLFGPHAAIVLPGCWLLEKAFSLWRKRDVDPHVWVHAIAMAVLLPVDLSWPLLLIGLLFGLVFGKVVFGGTGHYLIHPALLAAVFLHFSYPPSVDSTSSSASAAFPLWLPVAAFLPSLVLLIRWRHFTVWLLAGVLSGAVLGALMVYLKYQSFESWLTMNLFHPGFLLLVLFILPDPSVQPVTRAAKMLYGVLFVMLTSSFQLAGSDATAAGMVALLLTSLLVPALDRIVIGLHRRSLLSLGGSA